MHLQLSDFHVSDAVFGEKTELRNGVLTINRDELRQMLLKDKAFADVDISIVKPGDNTRVHNIIDVVEPRVRVSKPGSDFPGMVSPPRTVGDGRTNRLTGVSVVEVSTSVPGEQSHWRTAIIDMNGSVSELSPFGSLINIVVSFVPEMAQFPKAATGQLNVLSGTAEAAAYGRAVREGGLRAAVYLASPTLQMQPSQIKDFELDGSDRSLRRVVYMFQLIGAYAYGEANMSPGYAGFGSLPTIIHPNEILDGAIVNLQSWPACHRDVTYIHQNHPVVRALYGRNGSQLSFSGVVVYTRGSNAKSKERMSNYAANLASVLGADAAILTYVGSGHSLVDVMLTCQELERRGISTTVLLPEMAAGGDQSGLIYTVPEADAMVSTGNYEYPIEFPVVDRVIGGDRIAETDDLAEGPFTLPLRTVLASTDPAGTWRIRGREY